MNEKELEELKSQIRCEIMKEMANEKAARAAARGPWIHRLKLNGMFRNYIKEQCKEHGHDYDGFPHDIAQDLVDAAWLWFGAYTISNKKILIRNQAVLGDERAEIILMMAENMFDVLLAETRRRGVKNEVFRDV